MSLRGRVTLGIFGTTVALLLALCAVVYLRVRTDRLRALDEGLAAQARALGTMVELDHGEWEVDVEKDGQAVVASLAGWEVWTPGGEKLGQGGLALPAAEPGDTSARDARVGGIDARIVTKTVEVELDDQPEGEMDDVAVLGRTPVVVRVAVDAAPLRADLVALLGLLAATGGVFSVFAAGLAYAVAGRVLAPLRRMAERAEAVEEPSDAPQLPLSGSGDEIDRLARTLNRAFARLHAAWSRQARFTADAAHELRTPLASIRTEAEVSLRRPRAAEDYRASLEGIAEAAARMHHTLDAMLLLARAESGARPTAKVDLVEIAREVVRRAPGQWVNVRVEGPPSLAVPGDAALLESLLRNLVDNSLRHTPTGGSVTVSLSNGGPMARLVVRDTGHGIPPAALAHVFDRFFRVDEARSPEDGGAGLGLSIVRAVAERHGGHARVESEPGKGTAVTVELPC